MKLSATRYMRKPFFAQGFTIDENNIEVVAKWCGGEVLRDGETLYIWVAVEGARKPEQSRALCGDTVMKTKRGHRYYYKVYRPYWLDLEFFTTNGRENDFAPVDVIVVPDPPVPTDTVVEPEIAQPEEKPQTFVPRPSPPLQQRPTTNRRFLRRTA